MADYFLISAVFGATYIGMALGRVPGLAIDRVGIALFGLAVLLLAGDVGLSDIADASDMPTLVLLFALMILSAQFAAARFYDVVAARLAAATMSPRKLLLLTTFTSGGLSAVLVNDIVVFAFAPVLAAGLMQRQLDARPFLIALALGSNAGSAMTLIGNPQNILIGQAGALDFWAYLAVALVPSLIAMVCVYMGVAWFWRHSLDAPAADLHKADEKSAPATLNSAQFGKAIVATLVLFVLFASPMPREVAALGIAGLLLVSRVNASRMMLGAVDWPLLVLFACLFTITHAFAGTGLLAPAFDGVALERASVLSPLLLLMGNVIGNVPGVVMLLAAAPDMTAGTLYAVAIFSTLAGNLLLTGSLANIIVAERAASVGVRLTFMDFARAGVPVTLASLVFAAIWLVVLGLVTL